MIQAEAPPEERLFKLMRRVRRLGLDDHHSGDEMLSPAQMALLDAIASQPGCGVIEIAKELEITAPTVSVGVRRLEESGLVEREPDPVDGRSIQFFLTRRGQSLQRRIQENHLRKFRRLLDGLQPEDQETLLNLLQSALDAAEKGAS
ncbi:MAG: MarR family transcriptional regulator [Anaerolineales bacterium]|nr:MarR family transcriptional regulator [Anaerolineales bacterium]